MLPAERADDWLVALAGRVADGQVVDWSRADSTAATDDERAIVDQLRVLEHLHHLHHPAEPDTTTHEPTTQSPTTEAVTSTAAPERWGALEIRGVLGAGGFGVVYRAFDPELATEVALKVLKTPTAGSVIEEARLLARVRHPNVVSIYGAERRGGEVGMWMEFVRGRTLKQILKQHGMFGAREAALVALDLTRALAAVHAAGLVHRDVKPHNVMREDSGRVVLMDFGAGVELEELTEGVQRKYVGTPLYMAPELFDRHRPSPQTDLYSLGVLLYHLVSATYPVDGDGATAVHDKHVRNERLRLRDVRADLPSEFVRIVERAVDPDPAKRYMTAGELEADLARFVVTEERSPGRRAVDRRVPVWRARSRGVFVGIAAVLVAAVVLATYGLRRWQGRPAPEPAAATSPLRSLAVLPFLNLSGDPQQEYFADGVTDLLTADLSMIPGLKVISRTSAMSFKASKKPLPEIARALNVQGVIEGSVARNGERVQITLQVIEAGTDLHLWSQRYEGNAKDVMAFDGEIARRIARDIGAALSPALHDRLSGSSQIVSEAQDEYLRGRFASNAYTADGDREALRHFLNAVELDPSYALAHVALATAQRVRATQSSSPDREEFYRRARESARRAAQLDETLPGAHLAMANIELYSTWNWNAAEAEFTRALQLNPNDADAHQQYAWFLAARGQTDQALRHAQQARDLDPLTLIRSTTAAGILYYARRHAEAIKELQGVLAIDPNFVVAHTGLARTYAALRDFDQAVIEIRRAIALVGDDPAWLAELGRIDGEAGNTAEARRIARQVESRAAAGAFVGPETFAGLYAAAGDRERAFRVLEAGVRSRSSGLLWIKVDPRFDSLRGDPRFDRILELGGLHR